MPSTDSFTSTASVLSSTTGTFSVTDSFTSTAFAVSLGVALLSDPSDGTAVLTVRGWEVRTSSHGVTVSKASTFGGTQGAIPWPVSLDDARDLIQGLLAVVQ